MLGRPFGAPNEPEFQRKVLRALLALFERSAGPVLEDFPDDAPASEDAESGFACPVSFTTIKTEGNGLARAMHEEIAQLAPWYDLSRKRRGRTTVGVFGPTVVEAARHVASFVDGSPETPPAGLSAGIAVKRACDDIKAYYYEAVAAQPGNLAPKAIERWFWRDTSAAKAFLAIREICLASTDESLKPLGKLSLIPRVVTDGLAESQQKPGKP